MSRPAPGEVAAAPAAATGPAATQAVRAWGQAWPARPIDAWVVAVFVVTLPVALSQLVTIGLAQTWERPDSTFPLLGWWVGLALVALVVIESTLVVTRRLFPLAILLRLNLAFPSAAPSRYRVALRVGSPGRLQRHVTHAHRRGEADADMDAASRLLELVADLSRHDRRTRGHSERVRAYAELIAEELDLSRDDRHRLRWSALLHDVGKLRTPRSILNKPGRLTEDEYQTIKLHPLDGLELALPLEPWLGDYVRAVSEHHERWEGGGYPRGVAGEQIALAGRIVAVADAFDVMTSARSYKAPVPVDDARAELLRCSGTQFDPEIVRAFLAVPATRLRAVAGPLALLSPVLASRAASWNVPQGARAAAVAAAVVVAAVAAATAPTHDDEFAIDPPAVERETVARPAAPPTTGVPSPTPVPGPVDRVATVDQPPRSLRPTAAPPAPASPNPTEAPAVGDVAEDAPPFPPQPSPTFAPPPTEDRPLTVQVDPEAGRVAVEGLPVGPEPVPVVDADIVGAALCGGLGACDELTVETPIILPRI